MIVNATTCLLDLVKIYEAVPKSTCRNIIKRSNNLNWNTHSWSDYSKTTPSISPDTEFLRAGVNSSINLKLCPIINECLLNYRKDIFPFELQAFSGISLNKYDIGTEMLPHVDHIHSLFTGPLKGIPILSVIGLLNDDFEGGEFVFWNEETIKLKQGDVMIFPSLFAYSHRVKTIKKGSRYSFVCWAF
jgi:hypothetical protein